MTTPRIEYKVELANKFRGGRAVGNLYGVGRYIDGRRAGWALVPQDDEAHARAFAREANSPNAPSFHRAGGRTLTKAQGATPGIEGSHYVRYIGPKPELAGMEGEIVGSGRDASGDRLQRVVWATHDRAYRQKGSRAHKLASYESRRDLKSIRKLSQGFRFHDETNRAHGHAGRWYLQEMANVRWPGALPWRKLRAAETGRGYATYEEARDRAIAVNRAYNARYGQGINLQPREVT